MNSYDEIVKSNGPSKVYKEVYIPPDDKHKGFYRKYLVNTNSEKFAKIKARAEAGGAVSKLYKLYLNFVKLLEDHAIPNDPKEAHNQLMGYKAKLIKAVALAKTKHPPIPVFAFSDYTQRRLEESKIISRSKIDDTTHQSVTTRSLRYPGEKNTSYFDLDPKDEVVDFVNKNLVEPLKALKGTIKDHRGLDLDILSTNEHHFYQRAEFRISQYVEQYITEKHYHDLRMTLGYDIRDDDVPPDIKAEFETFRDVFEQHIRDDIDANADAMAKELCDGLIDTIKNPLWMEEGKDTTRRFDDPRKNGATEFHSKNFTVIVAHSGTLMSFWPNSAGERFAIEQGWRGATPKSDSSDESDGLTPASDSSNENNDSIPASKWETSGANHYDFLRNFDQRNFAVGYYPQFDVKDKVFYRIQWSNRPINYPDNYFIKRSQYEQYNTKQLLEIAAHHNIEVPKQAEGVSRLKYQNQLIDTLISNSSRDVCLDMEGEYRIPPMMQYDSTIFTDYDFSEPVFQPKPQQPSNNNHQQTSNNRPSQSNNRPSQNSRNQQNSRNSRRSGNAERGSSIGTRDMAALLAFRNKLPH